ncbi:MAG TPA: sigma-70 family RNA polymerase sigma factor, partial [Gemmataceae bacterium]|nr:sigma-70 family RNA polymerase sigma factor [Gemmataceae bacterium]
MPPAAVTALVNRCARLPRKDAGGDAELLRRAAGGRDRDALDELVRRYAGLVWGVCRRILRHEADAEDAFQATFLALVRQAPRINSGRPLAGWLHTVATRISRKVQVRVLRRPVLDTQSEPTTKDTSAEASSRELLGQVDEAIARLPARLCGPVVLCCVEGLTRDEAAEALGCSVAAVKSRLERGRRLLRRLLEKRGVALPAAFLVLGLGTAHVRADLRERAVAILSQPSPTVAFLAADPVRWKLAGTGLALLAAGVVGLAVLGLPQATPPKDPPAKETSPKASAERVDRLGDPLPDAALLRLGTTRFRHPGSATALALSPDEKTILTLGWEGLYVWDTATGKERWHVPGREVHTDLNDPIGRVPLALHPDGKRAISACDMQVFQVWDTATGKVEARRFPPEALQPGQHFESVSVSKDGNTLAFGGPQGVVLCDLDGKVLARIANMPVGPRNPNQDRLLAWDDFSYPRFAPDGKS